jgi:hypothetical protein
VRRLTGGPALPPNPTRRRHALKIATVWLLVVGTLFAASVDTVALILGGLLVAACATVTTTNFCIPSELTALWERRRALTHLRADT